MSTKKENYLKVGSDTDYRKLIWNENKFKIDDQEKSPTDLGKEIEPWLTALFQSERLNILVGSGLAISQEKLATGNHTKFMDPMNFDVFSSQIKKAGEKKAEQEGRAKPNIEDQINVANALMEGLNIYVKDDAVEKLKSDIEKLRENINKNLEAFLKKILSVEKKILNKKKKTKEYLIPFLMS